tara:strand:- start:47053 stop:47289 length:237 start_codon:yes stop_codon:yes gene_type:complete
MRKSPTTRELLNTKTIIEKGVEFTIKTIKKTIDVTAEPFVNTFFELSVNGQIAMQECGQHQVDFYIANAEVYGNVYKK